MRKSHVHDRSAHRHPRLASLGLPDPGIVLSFIAEQLEPMIIAACECGRLDLADLLRAAKLKAEERSAV